MKGAVKQKQAHVWARDEFDWYVETESASAALFRNESFNGGVYDPACGKGNIIRSARAAQIPAYGTDIVDRNPLAPGWFLGVRDFLHDDGSLPAVNIVTNPPFYRGSGTEAFIYRALTLAEGKVAVFAPLPFLAGSKRAKGLFKEFPPIRVWVLTPRVSCPAGHYLEDGGKAAGGTEDWCWIVWPQRILRRFAEKTELSWLNVKEN